LNTTKELKKENLKLSKKITNLEAKIITKNNEITSLKSTLKKTLNKQTEVFNIIRKEYKP